ncbi:MAG: hypothetical protein AB7U79_08030 [Candidatus Izemoplasmatales bacterium]
MSTSKDTKLLSKAMIGYLSFALFLVLFQFIYNIFAHGVTSYYMTYAFLFPLGIGGVRCLFDYFTKPSNSISLSIWQMGVSTLAVGSILHGVFDIYGNSNMFVPYFFYMGILLLVVSFIYELKVRFVVK